jgi:hypothetical protein
MLGQMYSRLIANLWVVALAPSRSLNTVRTPGDRVEGGAVKVIASETGLAHTGSVVDSARLSSIFH